MSGGEHMLRLERTLAAPRAAVWRCWSEPALLERWFCPKPWFVTDARLDLRTGGEMATVMNGPEGERVENSGLYLEVEPGRRLIFTDAFTAGWKPSAKAFIVAEITLDDAPDGGTLYTAVVRHWNEEDRKQHEEMGFHPGWNAAADQLEELARSLGGDA